MVFKLVAIAMAAIAGVFAFSVDSEHAFAAVLIPAAAAFGCAIFSAD